MSLAIVQVSSRRVNHKLEQERMLMIICHSTRCRWNASWHASSNACHYFTILTNA